jgi:hypothetical protein
MLAIYQRAKAECHYNATRFLAMVAERRVCWIRYLSRQGVSRRHRLSQEAS